MNPNLLVASGLLALAALTAASQQHSIESGRKRADLLGGQTASSPGDVSVTRVYTYYPQLTHSQMSSLSDVALHGIVRSMTCERNRGGTVHTRVELEVVDHWRGRCEGRETLILQGGRVGDQLTIADSSPQLTVGAEYVFYAERTSDRHLLLTTGASSSFEVKRVAGRATVGIGGSRVAVDVLRTENVDRAAQTAPVCAEVVR